MGDITKELVALAMASLELAADSIEKKGLPLKPFIVVEKDGERVRHEVKYDDVAEGRVEASRFAGTHTDADRVASVIDGFVTFNGDLSEGIVVEVADVGATVSHLVGVQYEIKSRLLKKTGMVLDHKPALMGVGSGFPAPA